MQWLVRCCTVPTSSSAGNWELSPSPSPSEGSGLDAGLDVAGPMGWGLSASLSHSAAPTYPDTTLAGAAEQRRGSCLSHVL